MRSNIIPGIPVAGEHLPSFDNETQRLDYAVSQVWLFGARVSRLTFGSQRQGLATPDLQPISRRKKEDDALMELCSKYLPQIVENYIKKREAPNMPLYPISNAESFWLALLCTFPQFTIFVRSNRPCALPGKILGQEIAERIVSRAPLIDRYLHSDNHNLVTFHALSNALQILNSCIMPFLGDDTSTKKLDELVSPEIRGPLVEWLHKWFSYHQERKIGELSHIVLHFTIPILSGGLSEALTLARKYSREASERKNARDGGCSASVAEDPAFKDAAAFRRWLSTRLLCGLPGCEIAYCIGKCSRCVSFTLLCHASDGVE
jgi:hypothetical protein